MPDEPQQQREQRGVPRRTNETRDAAMRTMERYAGEMDDQAAVRLDGMIRADDPHDWVSRYVNAVGNPDYASAFSKLAVDPQFGHLRFHPGEVDAGAFRVGC